MTFPKEGEKEEEEEKAACIAATEQLAFSLSFLPFIQERKEGHILSSMPALDVIAIFRTTRRVRLCVRAKYTVRTCGERTERSVEKAI